jgi:hypothetical protein
MRKVNPIIIFSIFIGMGMWLALDGYIKIVICLVAGVVLIVTFQLSVGWILHGIDKLREKRKNRKSN